MDKMNASLKKAVAVFILTLIILNSGILGIIEPVFSLAAGDATDYNFTDELSADRVGIGFKWTASTRTLAITAIKNSNALIELPDKSTIDIQGNIENTINGIKSSGTLTINGNNEASLKLSRCWSNGGSACYGIYTSTDLIINSGNININVENINTNSSYYYSGINSSNVTINSGNIDISIPGIGTNSRAIYAYKNVNINGGEVKLKSGGVSIALNSGNSGKIKINGGTIEVCSINTNAIESNTEINGGTITVCAKGSGKAFYSVPSINATVDWNILYNKSEATLENAVPGDITDIYSMYYSKIIKFECTSSTPAMTEASNATDYDFTDELNVDRVGIGFKWTASSKTLTITAIKNSNALIELPDKSTIDIQGNIENTINGIKSSGTLTINGNNEASLKLSRCWSNGGSACYGIYTSTDLIINSGNISINVENINTNSSYYYSGINSSNVTINSGNIDISIPGIGTNSRAIYAYKNVNINGGEIKLKSGGVPIALNSGNSGKIKINGGTIEVCSINTNAIESNTEINGGTITVCSKGSGRAFYSVPSINPNYDWVILYNKTEANLETATVTDITDIYTIYNSKIIRMSTNNPTTGISLTIPQESICVGESETFIANVQPKDSTETVTWDSDNTSIATVSQSGQVKGIAPGKATITATSGNYSDSKNIDVVCKITLNPNGATGLEEQTLYTDTNGKLTTLPILSAEGKYFEKWIDSEQNEVTIDKVYSENTTIFAKWLDVNLLVGKQSKTLKYGKNDSVTYEVTSNLEGTYTIKVNNLPEGITLENNEINFVKETQENKGTIQINVTSNVDACKIDNLQLVVDNKVISNDFSIEIEKLELIYEKPTGKSLLYTGNEQELIAAGTSEFGSFEYSINGTDYSSNIPKATSAGDYTIYYKVLGDKNHNNGEEGTITSKINKIYSNIQTVPRGKELQFNGLEQELIEPGTANGGTMLYSIDEGKTYSTQVPKAVEANTYIIYYKVEGDANHNDTEANTINAQINKIQPVMEKMPEAKTLQYNGNNLELVSEGVTNDGTIEYSLDGVNFSKEIPTATEVGKYTVYFRIIGDSNHTNSEINTTIASINKQDINLQGINVESCSLKYNGQEQELVKVEKPNNGILVYSLDKENYLVKVPTAKDAGTYTVYYKVIGDNNHSDSEVGSVTSIINKIESTYLKDVSAKSLTYNGTIQQLINEAESNDGTIQYSMDKTLFTEEIPTAVNAGKYTIYYRIVGDKNHNDSSIGSIVVTINKAEATLTELPKTRILTYNDELQELVTAGKTNDGTIVYSLNENTFASNIPTAKDCGIYTVYYKILGDSNHFDSNVRMMTSVISKANATIDIVPTSKNVTYNGKEQALINAGATSSGTIEYSLDGESFEDAIPTGLNAGTYTVYYRIIGDKNHKNSDIESLTAKINKKNISLQNIDINNNFLEYNGQEQPLLESIKIDYGTIVYSTDNTVFLMRVPNAKDVGVYTVYIKVIGDRNHNDSEVESVTSVISQAQSKYTKEPTAKDLTYNGNEQELIIAAETNDGTIEYSLDGKKFNIKLPTGVEAENYTVYYRIIGDSNHENSAISKIDVTIKNKEETKLTFDDVKQTDWYYNAVKYVYENNIIKGYDTETFAPNDKLTRGQLVTILHRMEGSPKVIETSKFSDVQDSKQYYYNAVIWGAEKKIVSGYDNGKFGAEDNITREQLAVILWKYAKYKGKDVTASNNLLAFTDTNKISSWALNQVKWAVGAGVISGNADKTLNPLGNATRAEVAAMLEKYCKKVGR